MKASEFYAAAIERLAPMLDAAGYHRAGEGTYRKEQAPTFGMMHLVDDGDRIMPRLSIGLAPVSDKGVVLSTDLHVLVSPQHFFWYAAANDPELALDQLQRDFRSHGLPWLERHLSLDGLTRAFETRVQATKPRHVSWWRRLGGSLVPSSRRKSLLDLQVLSYCYEFLDRDQEALSAWREYLLLLTKGGRENDMERLRHLEARAGRAV
jgi:hypothetical protein